MSTSLPDAVIRTIFEYAIDSYSTNNRLIYTLISQKMRLLFKEIIKFQVAKFRADPFAIKLYGQPALYSVEDLYEMAGLIDFSYNYPAFDASQAFEFMKNVFFSDPSSVLFKIYSYELLEGLINCDLEHFLKTTGLHYKETIAPIIIELFARNWYDFKVLRLASRFFGRRQSIYRFMTSEMIHWIENHKIPRSISERERLIKLIQRTQKLIILSSYAATSLFIVVFCLWNSFQYIYLIPFFLSGMILLLKLFSSTVFGIFGELFDEDDED